jgi:predicted nucleic acid-binding protein
MDAKLLPRRALLDTGVLIRALGEHPTDSRSADCREFVEAMVAANNDVLVAAPSLAEIIRAMAAPEVPATNNIEVVPFDDQAAIVLGTRFPISALKALAHSSGVTLTYLKYDALIAACAIRHRADFLVCIDNRLTAQVPRSLNVAAPGDFRAKQLQLPVEAGAQPKKQK